MISAQCLLSRLLVQVVLQQVSSLYPQGIVMGTAYASTGVSRSVTSLFREFVKQHRYLRLANFSQSYNILGFWNQEIIIIKLEAESM